MSDNDNYPTQSDQTPRVRDSAAGFEEDQPRDSASWERLLLNLDGFEGPIDLLLELAREQKVDVIKISILALADQYLEFIREAKRLRLEIAADYLVMAAWLAFLKSRLLLPEPEEEGDEVSGAEMAAALKFQLQRLSAMREAGGKLFDRALLGDSRLGRGMPEERSEDRSIVYEVSLFDLLQAYGKSRSRGEQPQELRILEMDLYSVEQALQRLASLLGNRRGWQQLSAFLPDELKDDLSMRSAIAAHFAASLELCREGKLDIRQDKNFAPIYLKAKEEARE